MATLSPTISSTLICLPFNSILSDAKNVTFRVSLSMTSSQPNNPIVGYQYEAPFIGSSDSGDSSTNVAPAAMPMNLTVTVSGLTAGKTYNLYRYQSGVRPLPKGPLNVPSTDFNKNAKLATATTTFKAASSTYQTYLSITSVTTVVFRCVLSTAS